MGRGNDVAVIETKAIERITDIRFHYVTEVSNGIRHVLVSTIGRFPHIYKLNMYLPLGGWPWRYYETMVNIDGEFDFPDTDEIAFTIDHCDEHSDELAVTQHIAAVKWVERQLAAGA